jgi:hypothetical protein
VGISNCVVAQMRKAAGVLGRYGVPLAANRVQYSLLHRKPETDGVLDACRQMDVALVAYRPAISSASPALPGRAALADALREVAAARGATAAQVALAWLLKRDDHVIAIPDRPGPNTSARTQPPSRWNSARRNLPPSTGRRRRPGSTTEGLPASPAGLRRRPRQGRVLASRQAVGTWLWC